MGGVYAHIKVFHVPPGAAGIQLVELGPATVDALNLPAQFLVSEMLLLGAFFTAAAQLAFYTGILAPMLPRT